MLNRIIIINSELYSKASIHIGNNSSIQIAAENNIGKSSFINTLNFLYITDKDQMRFEDGRNLSDSMKHYFDGTSFHSFIIFEIFKNGYYSILVKATPENSIEYYKINGEYKEDFYIEKSSKGFKAKRWNDILQKLTLDNPTDPPAKLTNEELYNLVYNHDKNKSPVVTVTNKVKRNNRKSFSNSFTDIYRHLIRTSEINEKSFKNALLIASGQQHIPLNVFSSSSFEKIDEFEKKKIHLSNLTAIKNDFEQLKLLNDTFISEESILGKLKHSFISSFNSVEKDLSEKIDSNSELSKSIDILTNRINKTLKGQRDDLVSEKAIAKTKIKGLVEKNKELYSQLEVVKDYEPEKEHLLFQGLLSQLEKTQKRYDLLHSQITQLQRSKFTLNEIEDSIKRIEKNIGKKETSIKEFDNLLYQNISSDPEIIRKVYSYLSTNVAGLNKSFIKKEISKADEILTFFDGKIDVSSIEVKKELPTIKQLQDEIETEKKELEEKKNHLEAIQNRKSLENDLEELKKEIKKQNEFIKKVENKPFLIKSIADNKIIIDHLQNEMDTFDFKIEEKDKEIDNVKLDLELKIKEKEQYEKDIATYKNQYAKISEQTDIYEIEENINIPFKNIYDEFEKIYRKYRITRDRRKELKDNISRILKNDNQDIKKFIREINEEIENIPQMDKIITQLLETLSHEIGSPTHSFVTQFKDFKTYVNKSYNRKLAEYPISNIQKVKVKINENKDLIEDLEKISNLKFSDGLDFDNSYSESKEALQRQLNDSKGKPINISDLFTIKIEITKVTGKTEDIDLSKQVQSRGTNIVLKLYLFLNILKDLVISSSENKIVIYIDELEAIGQKNIKQLIKFCKNHNFVPIFAAPRKVEGIQKYYMIKEPVKNKQNQKNKISFGELQSFPVIYRDAE